MRILELLLAASLVLFSGCVRMSTTQELKRDGLMNVLVIIDSPYFSISDSINNSVIPNPGLTPVAERINNTLIYYFSKVNPFMSDLFIGANNSEINVNASGFLGGNTFKYSKEFKFPFYYYYYSADFGSPLVDGYGTINESVILESISSIEFDYDVVYFGELVSTNAEDLGNNKVRLKANNQSMYNLTFKEFFLSNWISRLLE